MKREIEHIWTEEKDTTMIAVQDMDCIHLLFVDISQGRQIKHTVTIRHPARIEQLVSVCQAVIKANEERNQEPHR